MLITTVEYFMKYVVFSRMERKERAMYDHYLAMIRMVENGEILINNKIATSIYQDVIDGDVIKFKGVKYENNNINRFGGSIAYSQN